MAAPANYAPSASPAVAAARQAFTGRLVGNLKLDLADSLVQAIAEALGSTAKTLQELARIIQAGPAKEEFRVAHQAIGERAQQAVLNSYAQVVTARKRVPSYRLGDTGANQRYAGGKLKAALASPAFFSASERGLEFINVQLLDETARHWARLNAGAGSVGAGSRRSFDIQWSNLVIGALGVGMTPSPAFDLPRGYWFSPGAGPVPPGERGTSEFYPAGSGPRAGANTRLFSVGESGKRTGVAFQRRRVSRGIQARNFLDAGVARIANDLGPAYERLYKELYATKVAAVRPARANLHVVTHGR